MKKVIFRVFFSLFLLFALAIFIFLGYLYLPTNKPFDRDKLEKNNYSITFYDSNNNQINFASNYQGSKVHVAELPSHVKNAFIAVEDKRYYSHHGVDYRAILRALKNNFTYHNKKEGGSTITQQLIKNTHLSSEKTFERKIKEIKLAIALERQYTKQEILNFYLNGVYFGDGAYGIQCASQKYFGVEAKNLSLAQACALAATVKAPSVYNPKEEKCEERKNLVLKLMFDRGFITIEEFESAKNEKINTVENQKDFYLHGALQEVYEILNISPYQEQKIEVYTYLDTSAQSCIENTLSEYNQSAIIMGKTGEIKGYKMPQGNYERSIGSTIKPLLVYAPAIDMGELHLMSKILDEPCSFGDYCPKNYGDKYHGYLSAKDALSLSLNVPAVKILNSIGSEKARLYVDEEDGLNIALGSYNGGVKLTNLCSAYSCFLNQGTHYKSTFIKSISIGGKPVYKRTINGEKVFKGGTCELINNALMECSISGTAKAIGKRSYQVCSKTGTVGNKNGNSDAYAICYTSSDLIAVRFSETNIPLNNEITGGFVAKYAGEILNELYKNSPPESFESSGEVSIIKGCLISYEDGKIMKAHPSQPPRYTFDCPILTSELNNIVESDFFTPVTTCEIFVNDFSVKINVNKRDYVRYEVWQKKDNEILTLIYDGNESNFFQENLLDGNYFYEIIPYAYDNSGNKIYCESIILQEVKISRDEHIKSQPWWEND